MKFEHGMNLVKKIGIEREQIKAAQVEYEKMENEKLLLNKQSVINQEIEKVKARQMEIIECSRATARDYYQELIDLKKDIRPDNWQYVLQYLGYVLAKIDYTDHVEDCLDDEAKVALAVNYTILLLKRKNIKLRQALIRNDTDRVTILASEIAFYENDLKKHPLGVKKLGDFQKTLTLNRGR